MSVVKDLDTMIDEMHKRGVKPENIIMGKQYFYQWIVEITRTGDLTFEPEKRSYRFSHRDIPVIVCESSVLEVVPNAKFLIEQ